MKHPFYCVSNSLVILRKYWNQDSYERCVAVQNQPFQTMNLEQMHNFEQAIDIESIQRSNHHRQQQEEVQAYPEAAKKDEPEAQDNF